VISRSLLLALASIAILPVGARAYVLKRAESGAVVHFEGDVVQLRARESAACGPSRADLTRAATFATEAWRGVSNAPDLVLEDGRPNAVFGLDGENGIYVLCDWPFGSELAVTVASFDDDGRMIDADVLVNGARPIALLTEGTSDNTHYDLASILTHELGHVLGLDESRVRAATMWPTTMIGATSQRTLAPDDESGLIAIYGEPGAAEHLTYGCSAASSSRAPPFSAAVFVLALALTTWVRRGRASRGARGPCGASPRSARS
jgi:hypothetical protein